MTSEYLAPEVQPSITTPRDPEQAARDYASLMQDQKRTLDVMTGGLTGNLKDIALPSKIEGIKPEEVAASVAGWNREEVNELLTRLLVDKYFSKNPKK